MQEYQIRKTKSLQTDKAKPDRRKPGDDRALAAEVADLPYHGWRCPDQNCFGID